MVATPVATSRVRRVRPTSAGVVLAVLVALLAGYYAWTATSSGNPFDKVNPFSFKYGDDDYYNLQVDAWLKGRLWVDRPVPAAIARAKNPYDPSIPGDRMGDGSFYDGHYYLSWGPAPALTTFLPPRLVGLQIQENLAICLYCFFGVLFACGTLRLLMRRLLPEAPRSVLWGGYALLAFATAIPWILRRPTIYEAAITGAFFFMMAGLYVLIRETVRPLPPRTSRLALVGLLFGLGLLSRPNVSLIAVLLAGVAYALRHDGRLPRGLTPDRKRAVALVIGIPVLCGVLFMIYNVLRFSGPLDFGNKWQFASRDVRNIPFNDVANVVPALWGYLVAPLRLTLEFPYIHVPPPPDIPLHVKPGFGAEATGSVLWAAPIVLLAPVALVAGWWRRRRARREGTDDAVAVVPRIVLGLLLAAGLPLLYATYAVPGYTERYELDFMPYVVMATTPAWAWLALRARTTGRRRAWLGVGLALTAWSAVVGIAIGFTGYYDSLKNNNYGAFHSLERTFSPLPTLATKVAGRAIITAYRTPGEVTGPLPTYTTVGPGGLNFRLQPDQTLSLTITSPSERDVQFRFDGRTDRPGVFVVTRAHGGEPPVSTSASNGTTAALPIHLKSGLNYVDLRAAPGPDVRPPASGAAPFFWLDKIRLS